MNASFEEKSVWIQLVSMLLVMTGYLFVAGRMLASGVDAVAPFFIVFIVASVAMVVILVVGHIVAALTGPADPADERDRQIGWRAESRSSWVLGASVLIAVAALSLGLSTAWIANLLMVSMFVSEVLKYTLQLWYYRRGM